MLIVKFNDGSISGIRCDRFECLPNHEKMLYVRFMDDHRQDDETFSLADISEIICDGIVVFQSTD